MTHKWNVIFTGANRDLRIKIGTISEKKLVQLARAINYDLTLQEGRLDGLYNVEFEAIGERICIVQHDDGKYWNTTAASWLAKFEDGTQFTSRGAAEEAMREQSCATYSFIERMV